MKTKKLPLLLGLVLCLLSGVVRSAPLVGLVVDEQNAPLPYANVYLKHLPADGTITNLQGVFRLNIADPSTGTLIISFLGYEHREVNVATLSHTDTLRIVLKEQPIQLREMTVVSDKKLSRKQRRNMLRELLDQVAKQMAIDFPSTPIQYDVVSTFGVYNGATILGYQQAVGAIREQNHETTQSVKPKTNKRQIEISFQEDGTVQFKPKLIKNYINPRLEAQLREEAKRQEEGPNILERIDSTAHMHQLSWGGGLRNTFSDLAKDIHKWQMEVKGDETVLTYVDQKNYIGIVVATANFQYIVDSHTLSIKQVNQSGRVKVTIPFGYKLKPDELRILNMVGVNQKEIEKFRLKQVEGTLQRNAYYTNGKQRSFVKEKNSTVNTTIIGNKKQTLTVRMAAKMQVTESKTQGVTLWSKKELKEPAESRTISIVDVK